MDAVQGSRFEAAFTAAVAIGLRQGEILGLQWSDLDLTSGKLTVREALQRVDKKLIRVEPKSRTSKRTIQLPAVCVSVFAQHKPIRFHDLRHSAATLLLAQDVSPRYITELLGHSQVSFTMETYVHVLDEVKKEVATRMDEILARPPVANRVANKTRPAHVS